MWLFNIHYYPLGIYIKAIIYIVLNRYYVFQQKNIITYQKERAFYTEENKIKNARKKEIMGLRA